MSIRVGVEEAPGTGAKPVFVDDSGRRRAWVHLAGRGAVVLLAIYVALVAIGLTGSLTFPVVNLGAVGRLPSPGEPTALGPDSHRTALPAAAAPARPGVGVPPANEQLAGTPRVGTKPVRALRVVAPSQVTPSSVASLPAVQHGKSQKFSTTTITSPLTTVAPVGSGSHGQPTRRRGPPTSIPGKGKGP
jgi:hypothetical protein